MNKRILTYSLVMLTTVLAACADKNSFTINGELQHPGVLKKVFLAQVDSSGSAKIIDSTNLSEDGKFQFKHFGAYPVLYKLRIGSNKSAAPGLPDATGVIYDLIAQNGEVITFKSDLDNPNHGYAISGSEESEKIQEFNRLSNEYGKKSQDIINEYQAKSQQAGASPDALMAVYKPKFSAVQNELGQHTLAFVNANQSSLAAFYAAISLDMIKYEPNLVEYAEKIKDKTEFKGNTAVQQFIKQMEAVKPISVGHKAPEFTIKGLDGKDIKLSDYKGKYVMLDFWASWCGPCRLEMPNVVKQYNAFRGKGLNILGISLDEDRPNWEKAIKDLGMTWAQASDLQKWNGQVEQLYMIQAIPANFIIDPQGNIVAKNLAGTDLEEFLKTTLK